MGWEGTPGSRLPRQGAQSSCAFGGAGEEQRILVLLAAGQAGDSPTALSFVPGELQLPGGAHSGWFGGPNNWTSGSTPALVCKAQLQAVQCP